MVTVYYYSHQHPNTISLGALKCHVCSKSVTSEPLDHYNFVDPQDISWRSPYMTHTSLDYLHIDVVKVNPTRNKDIVFPTIYGFLKHLFLNLSINVLVVSTFPDYNLYQREVS